MVNSNSSNSEYWYYSRYYSDQCTRRTRRIRSTRSRTRCNRGTGCNRRTRCYPGARLEEEEGEEESFRSRSRAAEGRYRRPEK